LVQTHHLFVILRNECESTKGEQKEMKVKNSIVKLGTILAALFFLAGTISCGGGKQAKVEIPEALIKDYIAKHTLMVDPSLAQDYIKDEQAAVTKLINATIEAKKKEGTLGSLQQATFEFTNLTLNVVGQTEYYVDDEPQDFIKVAASGSLVIKTGDTSKNISVDDTIILEKERGSWKVTEKINPWG